MRPTPSALLLPLMAGIAAVLTLAIPLPSFAQAVTACLQCHGAQTGRGEAPVPKWQGSVHADNGISCHDCHGGDPKDIVNAMNPARGFLGVPREKAIPAFCGRCHVGIMREYLRSAHGKALGAGGPTCVTCHDSHAVKRATIDLINEASCGRCHPYARAVEIKEAMRQTEGIIGGIEKDLTRLRNEGIDVEASEKSLFSLRNTYRRLFHVVDTARVKRESGTIQQELGKIRLSLTQIDERQRIRKIAGAFVVGSLLLSALLLHLLRRTYDDASPPGD
ncbi:cytochrome c3 family protein [Geobacter pickeringii]|uniref:Cytochrome C n=1 Tax=Geobacter pickeringii TaxID=345632 RepID=A0A0B5BDI6_9BACT|nr:cytochrome c3 family protein [Geobacter pickeringii]AJE03194.1 cytochrome C [Geobacter pickeringii]